ncbi:hypothetical protein, partial [Thiolapillus sp.]
LSGAFGYLFGSAMAANDDSYGQNEMAMISEDKWGYIMSRSPRLSGLYDDADHFDVEYFDPRAISETGPTWENFGEYVADVGPYFIGSGAGIAIRGAGLGIKLYRYRNVRGWGIGITKYGKSRYLRIDIHDGVEKYYGTTKKVFHQHWGRSANQMSKHR